MYLEVIGSYPWTLGTLLFIYYGEQFTAAIMNVSEGVSLDAAIAWASGGGELSVKGMKKALPKLCAQLVAGTAQDARRVAQNIGDGFVRKEFSSSKEGIFAKDFRFHEVICVHCAEEVTSDERLQYEFTNAMLGSVAPQLETLMASGVPMANIGMQCMMIVQQTFNETAAAWMARLPKVRTNRCKVFQCSKAEWMKWSMQLMMKSGITVGGIKRTSRQNDEGEAIVEAVTRIALAIQQGKKTTAESVCIPCSHCGTFPGADDQPFNRCARCKVARYCSLACQKKAWKSGHKAECKAKKAGLKAIKKAVKSTAPKKWTADLPPAAGRTERIVQQPQQQHYNEFIDFQVATMCAALPRSIPGDPVESLHRVVDAIYREGWWLFGGGHEERRANEEVNAGAMQHFSTICTFFATEGGELDVITADKYNAGYGSDLGKERGIDGAVPPMTRQFFMACNEFSITGTPGGAKDRLARAELATRVKQGAAAGF